MTQNIFEFDINDKMVSNIAAFKNLGLKDENTIAQALRTCALSIKMEKEGYKTHVLYAIGEKNNTEQALAEIQLVTPAGENHIASRAVSHNDAWKIFSQPKKLEAITTVAIEAQANILTDAGIIRDYLAEKGKQASNGEIVTYALEFTRRCTQKMDWHQRQSHARVMGGKVGFRNAEGQMLTLSSPFNRSTDNLFNSLARVARNELMPDFLRNDQVNITKTATIAKLRR